MEINILAMTKHITDTQRMACAVNINVLNGFIAALKKHIEMQPVGADTTKYMFMLRAYEAYKSYQLAIMDLVKSGVEDGVYDALDAEEYDRIVRNMAMPDSTSKQ